jgi:hypothetical protein
MSIEVTLNIFSGRENPRWVIPANKEKDLMKHVEKITTPTLQKAPAAAGLLGYRGLTIKRSEDHPQGALKMLVHEGIVDFGRAEENLASNNRKLEQWLLESAPIKLESPVKTYLKNELAKPSSDVQSVMQNRAIVISKPPVLCPVCKAADAPVYNPGIWNVPNVQPFNNCYNYANNQITNTFAQPGRAHGAQATTMACANVTKAAKADGLVTTANFTTALGAGKGWYVALVIWPGVDYHWYRQDKVGCWSHKPGQTAARNTDNSGNPISNPKTCNRGPYVNFCTFMITKKGLLIN